MVFLLLLSCNIIALSYIDVFFKVIPFLIEFKAFCKTDEKVLKAMPEAYQAMENPLIIFWLGNEWNL